MYLIFVLYLATVFASNHEKYIDLLPEEEKQEFLDRVIRRIMDNVKAKANATTSSENLSDDQLKNQDDFVKAIIKEESKHIEMIKDKKVDFKDTIDKKLDVKSLRTIQREGDNNADNLGLVPVDLTVNDDKRRSYNELSTEKNTEVISTDVNNNISSLEKRSVQMNVTNIDTEDKHTAQELYHNEPDKDEIKQTTMNTNSQSTSQINDMKIISIAPFNVNDNISQEINDKNLTNIEKDSESNPEIGEEITPATETYIDATTIKEAEPVTNYDIAALNDTVIETNNNHIKTVVGNSSQILKEDDKEPHDFLQYTVYKGKNNHENEFEIITDSTFSSNLTDEGTTEIIKKTTAYNNKQHAHIKIPKKAQNVKKNHRNRVTGIDAKLTDKTITKTVIKNSIPNITHGNNNQKLEIKLQNRSKLSELVSEALKKTKDKYINKYSKAKVNKNIINSQVNSKVEKTKFAIKHYRVYEVDIPPISKSLLRDDKLMVEQPHYVPVYDYSPNKAYFNPDNRYGPNDVEDESNDDILLRKGEEDSVNDDNSSKADNDDDVVNEDSETNPDYMSHVKKFALYQAYTTRVPTNGTSTVVKHKKHKNPKPDDQNNIDEDASDQIHFPDSYEHLHPFNNMEGGMKSHISAIREVLYNNGIFGEFHHNNKNNEDINDRRKKKLLRSNKNKFQLDIGGYKITIIKNDEEITDNKIKKKSLTNLFRPIDTTRNYNVTKMNTISEIIGVTDEKDVFLNLKKLKDMNINFMRSDNDMDLEVYLKAIKDMIDEDSEALKQYDWLSTTVQIQSALEKLKDLLQRLRKSKPIHASDMQILNYMVFLHSVSLEIQDARNFGDQLRNRLLLPKNKKIHNKILKEKGLIDRVWLYLRSKLSGLTVKDGLVKLEEFVLDIENGLFDLHDALKNIALITKYNNQNWYRNLRDLYLTTEQKHLHEILLHLSVFRLIELIEKSCENGLEENFVKYLKIHRKEGKNALNETMFILRILDEIRSNGFK